MKSVVAASSPSSENQPKVVQSMMVMLSRNLMFCGGVRLHEYASVFTRTRGNSAATASDNLLMTKQMIDDGTPPCAS